MAAMQESTESIDQLAGTKQQDTQEYNKNGIDLPGPRYEPIDPQAQSLCQNANPMEMNENEQSLHPVKKPSYPTEDMLLKQAQEEYVSLQQSNVNKFTLDKDFTKPDFSKEAVDPQVETAHFNKAQSS